MLYEWLFPLSEQWTLFNLLRYITFRSIAAFFTAFLIGVWIAPWFIRQFQKLKVGQSIRDDGPQSHLVKAGTPTMGGVFILLAALLSILLWSRFNFYVLLSGLSLVLFGAIGFLDDYLKIRQKNTKGVSARLKLILQGLASLVLMLLFYFFTQSWDENRFHLSARTRSGQVLLAQDYGWSTNNTFRLDSVALTNQGEVVSFFLQTEDYFRVIKEIKLTEYRLSESGQSLVLDLYPLPERSDAQIKHFGWQLKAYTPSGEFSEQLSGGSRVSRRSQFFRQFYLPYYSKPLFTWPLVLAFLFYITVMVAFSNATNLSDGLDGLASGMGIFIYLPFGVFAYVMGNAIASEYLLFPYLAGGGELTVVITAFIGGLVAFLWYNVHPARIFMGDTGSLAMGGLISTIAIMLKQEVLLVIAGGMFVLEALSVVLQVFWFKNFKRRIFKMSPIHHHFELSGWKETQVVPRFWILSAIFALLALSALKIR